MDWTLRRHNSFLQPWPLAQWLLKMYVKIRRDGAVGLGRATDSAGEITIGYGEAHMVAAALEKLAQTVRNYRQEYRKTTNVGGGNKIIFERTEDGSIKISGDRQTYLLTEEEVRNLASLLKNLPPVEVAPASDYVRKITPKDDLCLELRSGDKRAPIKVTEAAILKMSIQSSVESRYFEEHITIDGRQFDLVRSSDLKWSLNVDGEEIRFTAYEVEAVIAGLHNGILDVLMDLVKSLGSDEIADIRIKSRIQHIEQETTKILGDHRDAKNIVKTLVKMAKQIVGGKSDAELRTEEFIAMCNYVWGHLDRSLVDPILRLLASAFVYVP